jgi:ABC-type sugar transport system ATPase subunit
MVATRQEFFYREHLQGAPQRETALDVRDLSQHGCFENVTFTLHSGEILGIGGLLGSGKSDLARALAGDRSALAGRIAVLGERYGRHQLPQ